MSTKYCGYCGKVLKVNLTDRSVSEYPFSDKDREKYLGGKIMAAKIIADQRENRSAVGRKRHRRDDGTAERARRAVLVKVQYVDDFAAYGVLYVVKLRR